MYVVQSDTGQGIQNVLDSATAEARKELADRLEETLERRTKTFREASNEEHRRLFAAILKETANTLSEESPPEDRELYAEDEDQYLAYVLMAVPLKTAAEKLRERTRDHEELHDRFQASRAYEEMTRASEKTETSSRK